MEIHKEVSQIKKSHKITKDDSSEKVASLKSLNSILLNETRERRQEVETLLQSKKALELEISRSLLEKQRLELQKKSLEDETIVAELEQRLTLDFVSSHLNQQAESLRNQITRAHEDMRSQTVIFKAKLEEKINDKEKALEATEMKVVEKQREINQISEEFRSYKNEVQDRLVQKQEEAGRLSLTVSELEKSNAKAQEEIGRLRMERDEFRQEVEQKYRELKREMESALRERAEIEAAKKELIRENGYLQKSVDTLTAELGNERELSSRVLGEKHLIQQDLNTSMEEIKRLTSTLLELQKNISETHEELLQLQTEHKLLMECKEKMDRSLAALEGDKASAERSLKQSWEQIEDLKREVTELVADKEQIQTEKIQQAVKITELQEEVGQLSATISSLQKQEESLQVRISELGTSYADAREKHEKLLTEFNLLVEEKKEKERILDELMEENSSVRKSLDEVLRQLEEQGRKMEELVVEKAEIEQLNVKLEAEIVELHEGMAKLKATVIALQESSLQYEEKQEQLLTDFNMLVEEKKEKERIFDELMEEKSLARKSLDESLQQMEEQGRKMEEIVVEKAEIEQVKIKLEAEIVQLHEEIDKLKATLISQNELCLQYEEKNNQLEVEAVQNKEALDRVAHERDVALKLLDMEKKELSCLRLKFLEVEKNVEETKKELAQISTERDSLVEEKKEMDNKLQLLNEEKASLQKALSEAQQGLEDFQVKMTTRNKLTEKKKINGFWTLLSSATIFAAASMAFVTRGR